MSRNTIHVDAPPERVWEVLADPRCYPRWVVGAKRFRAADPGFPAPGTKFHHSVGVGPLEVRDHTEVLQVQPPRRIVLRAKARPLGTFVNDIRVEPDESGSRVTLVEEPADAITKLLHNRVLDRMLHARNREALRRFKALSERPPAQGRSAAAAA